MAKDGRQRGDSGSSKRRVFEGTGYEALGASISTMIFFLLALNLNVQTIALVTAVPLVTFWMMTSKKDKRPKRRPRVDSRSGSSVVLFTVGSVEDGEAGLSLEVEDSETMSQYAAWIRTFVEKSNKSLGRSGPVCPFVPRALRLDSIHLCVHHSKAASLQNLHDAAIEYKQLFDELKNGMDGPKSSLCLVVCFPDLTATETVALKEVPRRLLQDFVQNGLMVSTFSPADTTPGVHNKLFTPRQAPCPSLLIRHMTKEDLVFISGSGLHPKTISTMMNSYLQCMGPELDLNRRDAALSFIAQAAKSLNKEGESKDPKGIAGRLRSYSAELNENDIDSLRSSTQTSPLMNPMNPVASGIESVINANKLEL